MQRHEIRALNFVRFVGDLIRGEHCQCAWYSTVIANQRDTRSFLRLVGPTFNGFNGFNGPLDGREGLSGIQTAKLIRINSPRTVVIGLTAGEPDHEDMEMIAAGASAVLNKADVIERLYPAIIKNLKSHHFGEVSVPLS